MEDRLIASCSEYAVAPGQLIDLDMEGQRVFVALFRSDDESRATSSFILLTVDAAKEMASRLIEAADTAESGGGSAFPPSQPGTGRTC